MASSRACNAAIFNKLNAMMELSMWVLICQLFIWITSILSGNINVDSRVRIASGKMASPSFSTGLLSDASNNKNATKDEMIEAVLNKLKLRLVCCWNILKVYPKCEKTANHAGMIDAFVAVFFMASLMSMAVLAK